MGRGTSFMVGELLRRASAAGVAVALRLTFDNSVNRARQSGRFEVAAGFADAPGLGFVVLDDERGRALSWTFDSLGKWLVKYSTGHKFALTIAVDDASSVGVGFKGSRFAEQLAKVTKLNAVGTKAEATAKRKTVEAWATSARKSDVLAAADNMDKAAALIDYIKGSALPPAEVAPTPAPTPAPIPAPKPVPTPAPAPSVPGQYPATPSNVRPWLVATVRTLKREAPFEFGLGTVYVGAYIISGVAAEVADKALTQAAGTGLDCVLYDYTTGRVWGSAKPNGMFIWASEPGPQTYNQIRANSGYILVLEQSSSADEWMIKRSLAASRNTVATGRERYWTGEAFEADFTDFSEAPHWGAGDNLGLESEPGVPAENPTYPLRLVNIGQKDTANLYSYKYTEEAARSAFFDLYGHEAGMAETMAYTLT